MAPKVKTASYVVTQKGVRLKVGDKDAKVGAVVKLTEAKAASLINKVQPEGLYTATAESTLAATAELAQARIDVGAANQKVEGLQEDLDQANISLKELTEANAALVEQITE